MTAQHPVGTTMMHSAKVVRAIPRRVHWLAAAVALLTNGATSAFDLPTTNLVTAPPVSTSVLGNYSSARTEGVTTWTGTPPELAALARTLGAEHVLATPQRMTPAAYAQNVYDYVRNNIELELRFGLGKGGYGALVDQSGTPFDQAELIVKLLAQANVSATYEFGTVTLTAQQFAQMTGSFTSLTPVTVDAHAACQLLADGGIPTSLTMGSCNNVSGNLTNVTFGHVWVLAAGSRFDPSFKTHVLTAPVDVPQWLGCGSFAASTCGADLTTAAAPQSTTITVNNVTYPAIQNLSRTGVDTYLRARAVALQGQILTTNRLGFAQDVVGGKRLVNSTHTGTTALPYPSSLVTSWNAVPNSLRTTLRIRFRSDSLLNEDANGIDQTFFADEIAGRILQIEAQGGFRISGGTVASPGACPGCTPSLVVLDVDHPYAAASNAYADEHMEIEMWNAEGGELYRTLPARGAFPLTFVTSFGNGSESTERHVAAIMEGAGDAAVWNDSWLGQDDITAEQLTSYKQFEAKDPPLTAAKLLSQTAAADRLIAGMTRSSITRHHDIGVLFSHPNEPVTMQILSVESSLSVNTHSSAATAAALRVPAFEASVATSAMLEANAAAQLTGITGVGMSAANVIATASAQTKFYEVPAATLASGAYTGGLGFPYTQRMRDAGTAGYSGIFNNDNSGGQSGAQILTRPNSVAHTLYLAHKGGTSLHFDPVSKAMKTTELVDAGAARKKYASVSPADGSLTIQQTDLATGVGAFPVALPFTRTYRSDRNIRDDSPMFENRLSTFETDNYTWLTSHRYEGPDSHAGGRLGGGWNHNYNVIASYVGNGSKALGADSALEASSAIAALWTLIDAARAPTLTTRVSSMLAEHWLAGKLIYNSVVLDLGGPTESFQELADDTLYSAKGASRLVKTGGQFGWTDGSMTLTYTGKDGDIIAFKVGKYSSYPINANGGPPRGDPIFVADTWSFPDGTVVTFEYDLQWYVHSSFSPGTTRGCFIVNGNTQCVGPPSAIAAPRGLVLRTVRNNFGRRLEFNTVSTSAFLPHPNSSAGWQEFTSTFRITRVTDENGRFVEFGGSGCPQPTALACNTFTVSLSVDPGAPAAVETYDYQASTASPDPVFTQKGRYRLRRWLTPEPQTTPYRVFRYDPLFRVQSVSDARGHSTFHYPGSVVGTENWKRAETVSGVGAVTVTEFDNFHGAIRSVNPLGHVTRMEYDNIGRLLRTFNPEGDSLVRAYDARSNLLSTTRIAKAGSGLANTVTSTTYGEAESVLACANLRTCNKPATETNGRGFLSRNTWDPATGLLLRVEAGLDSSLACHSSVGTTCPQTDLLYTPAQTNGVFMLRETTQRLDASLNLVNTFSYDSANHWVLRTGVADSGTERSNFTTTLTFDAIGNLTQADGPRVDAADVRNFVWNSQRRLRLAIEPDPEGSEPRVAVRTTYDRDGLVLRSEKGTTTDAQGADFVAVETTTFAYDGAGNRIRETTPAGVTQFAYDQDDRLLCTAVRMNPAVYDSLPLDDPATTLLGDDGACALSIGAVHGADRITRNDYDLAGQVLREQRAYGTPLQQDYFTASYTPNGKQDWVEDANGNRTELVYDGFDRLCRMFFPVATLGAHQANTKNLSPLTLDCTTLPTASAPYADYEQYGYDANDNRFSIVRRRGSESLASNTIGFIYDALDRETRKDLPNSDVLDVHSRYDLVGRRLFMHFGSSAGSVSTNCNATATGVDYCYDRLGRLTRENAYGRPLDYQYDEVGNRERITWPGSTYFVEYTYDATGRMKLVCENSDECTSGVLATYGYDSLGRRGTITRPNGVTSQFSYDGASRLSSLGHDMAGSGLDVTFGLPSYNPASEVLRRSRSNSLYAYSVPVANRSYVPDGLNRYDFVGGVDASYDVRGNLSSDGSRTFTYDVENRLMSVSGAASMSIGYDPAGRLLQTTAGTTITTFLYDGPKLTAEYNGTGTSATVLRRYVHGAGLDEPLVWYEGPDFNNKRWYHADHQGSAIATSDGTGAATAYAYGPYGEPKNDDWTGARFRYTGQIILNDAVGLRLYHYKARVYDPYLGRFLQTDPVGYKDDFNLYAYVDNDPLNKTDPTGMYDQHMAQAMAEAHRFLREPENRQALAEQAKEFATAVRNGDKEAIGAAAEKAAAVVVLGGVRKGRSSSRSSVTETHHVVAQSDGRAAPARANMRANGIEPKTDKTNLVDIPGDKHDITKRDSYVRDTNDRIASQPDAESIKAECCNIADNLRNSSINDLERQYPRKR